MGTVGANHNYNNNQEGGGDDDSLGDESGEESEDDEDCSSSSSSASSTQTRLSFNLLTNVALTTTNGALSMNVATMSNVAPAVPPPYYSPDIMHQMEINGVLNTYTNSDNDNAS